jgi:HPt (histidine-containing phosphotransfer) domain-containing protein
MDFAMIDKVTFNEMYDNFDKEVVVEIIDIFINEYPARMQAIHEAILSLDFDAINKRCHSLKGVISNFYDEEARSLAYVLEQKGRQCDSTGLLETFVLMKPATESLLNELKALRNRYI